MSDLRRWTPPVDAGRFRFGPGKPLEVVVRHVIVGDDGRFTGTVFHRTPDGWQKEHDPELAGEPCPEATAHDRGEPPA